MLVWNIRVDIFVRLYCLGFLSHVCFFRLNLIFLNIVSGLISLDILFYLISWCLDIFVRRYCCLVIAISTAAPLTFSGRTLHLGAVKKGGQIDSRCAWRWGECYSLSIDSFREMSCLQRLSSQAINHMRWGILRMGTLVEGASEVEVVCRGRVLVAERHEGKSSLAGGGVRRGHGDAFGCFLRGPNIKREWFLSQQKRYHGRSIDNPLWRCFF